MTEEIDHRPCRNMEYMSFQHINISCENVSDHYIWCFIISTYMSIHHMIDISVFQHSDGGSAVQLGED